MSIGVYSSLFKIFGYNNFQNYYIESESENSNSKETTPKSKTDSKSTKINNNTDFSSAFNE
jgi:hypothetical protein